MKSDLVLLKELGERRRPPVDEPAPELRHRVLSDLGTCAARSRRLTWPTGLRPAWRVSGLVAFAAALVAVTFVVVVDRSGPAARPPDRAAVSDPVEVLRLAAAHSAVNPELTAAPDQFLFVESVDQPLSIPRPVAGGGYELVRYPPTRIQDWRSVDGSRAGFRRWQLASSIVDEWSGAWSTGCLNGTQAPTLANPFPTAPCTPRPGYRPDLPRNADAMLTYLYHPDRVDLDPPGEFPTADQRALGRAAAVLRDSLHSPTVQAAVFGAVSRIPGMAVIPNAVDVAGRTGVAVARTDGGARYELLFDPATYGYLGVRDVVVDPLAYARIFSDGPVPRQWQVGEVVWATAILRVAVVDEAGRQG